MLSRVSPLRTVYGRTVSAAVTVGRCAVRSLQGRDATCMHKQTCHMKQKLL